MYQAVRQTAEDNTPDTYLPMEGAGKKLLGQKDQRTTPLGELVSKDSGSDGAAVAAKEGESKAAEDAKAADGEAGSSGGDKGPQGKSNDEEENENTPLLKPGQS